MRLATHCPLEQSLLEKSEVAASAPLPPSDTSYSSSSPDEQLDDGTKTSPKPSQNWGKRRVLSELPPYDARGISVTPTSTKFASPFANYLSQQQQTDKVQIALVQDQLRELTTQVNKPAASSVRQENQQRLRTSSPRRVRFEEERLRYSRDDEGYRDWPDRRYETDQQYQPRSFTPGRFRGDDMRRGRGNGRFDRGRGIRTRPFDRRSAIWEERQQQAQCTRCGRGQHQNFNQCPAVNKICLQCGKKGHFQRVCRMQQRAQMQ